MAPRKPTELDPPARRKAQPARISRGRSRHSAPKKSSKRQGPIRHLAPSKSAAAPAPLRLVGGASSGMPGPKPTPEKPVPIHGPTDPRWVLAVRTAESLQGDILAPDKRESLMRIGRAVGLSPFDSCLILAIIQDQARRGMIKHAAPAAAEDQLAMIPLPSPRGVWTTMREHPARVGLTIAGILGLQFVLLWLWLG